MSRIKQYVLIMFNWCFCFCVAFIIVNALCFFYERPVGWYDTLQGPTIGVRMPNSILLHGTEGYAITRIDKNGYTNPKLELSNEYVLMLGASHTQGKEIDTNKKYSVLVNEYFENDGLLHTYNIAADGHFLPTQIKHFKAAMEAYPDASYVTLEIGTTDFPIESLMSGINQIEYNPDDSADMFYQLGTVGKIKNAIKMYFPLIARLKNQIETYRQTSKASHEYEYVEFEYDENEYAEVLNIALGLMRSECSKPFVIIYHPDIFIEKDGSASLVYSGTWELFKNACEKNNIDLIDTGEDFLRYYNEYNKLPYGFMNTIPGSGHLNEVGHRIIADAIIDYLEEKRE